jgi:hypothetical protein
MKKLLLFPVFIGVIETSCTQVTEKAKIDNIVASIDNSNLSVIADTLFQPQAVSPTPQAYSYSRYHFTATEKELMKFEIILAENNRPLFISYYDKGKPIKAVSYPDSQNLVEDYYSPSESDSLNDHDIETMKAPDKPKDFHRISLENARLYQILFKKRKI